MNKFLDYLFILSLGVLLMMLLFMLLSGGCSLLSGSHNSNTGGVLGQNKPDLWSVGCLYGRP